MVKNWQMDALPSQCQVLIVPKAMNLGYQLNGFFWNNLSRLPLTQVLPVQNFRHICASRAL